MVMQFRRTAGRRGPPVWACALVFLVYPIGLADAVPQDEPPATSDEEEKPEGPAPAQVPSPLPIARPPSPEKPKVEDKIERAVERFLTKLGDKLDEEDDERGERTRTVRVDAEGPPSMVAIMVPLGFFACVIGVVALILVFRSRNERTRHETIRLAIEKGVEIPSELLLPSPRRRSDVRRGLVLVSGGFGLLIVLWLTSDPGERSWAIGIFPLMVGLGYLAAWWIERGNKLGRGF